MRTLYISYNGALDSLGQSQVLPYLRELRQDGHVITLLTFERRANSVAARAVSLRREMSKWGLGWTWLWYHKRPPVISTLWDLARGVLVTFWLAIRHNVQALHARSQVSAAMVWPVARLLRRRFIFDLRGQMAYEYADGGTWREGGLLYRLVERAERRFIKDADAIVVLTHTLADDLKCVSGQPPVVIPTCVDLEVFGPLTHAARSPRMVYCGSLGARYAPDLLVHFYLAAARAMPSLDLLILTHSDPSAVKTLLADAAAPEGRCTFLQVSHREVPKHLASGSFGVLLLQGNRSLRGACPTKVAEYLAAGLPVVSSPGIGDLNILLPRERVGVVLQDHSQASIAEGVAQLTELLSEGEALRVRCRGVAEREYSLAGAGGPSYRALYRDVEARL